MKDGISTLIFQLLPLCMNIGRFFPVCLLHFPPLLPDMPPLSDAMETSRDSER